MDFVKEFVWECFRLGIILVFGYAFFKVFVMFVMYHEGGHI